MTFLWEGEGLVSRGHRALTLPLRGSLPLPPEAGEGIIHSSGTRISVSHSSGGRLRQSFRYSSTQGRSAGV